jgi:hypothetical protein
VENDPEMQKYWMKQGLKTAVFPLVIPGRTLMGYGTALMLASLLACGAIGLGAWLLAWGLVEELTD